MKASVKVDTEMKVLVVTAPNGRRIQWDYATDVSPFVWNSIGELPSADANDGGDKMSKQVGVA